VSDARRAGGNGDNVVINIPSSVSVNFEIKIQFVIGFGVRRFLFRQGFQHDDAGGADDAPTSRPMINPPLPSTTGRTISPPQPA
jgi:hypothetical protein